mmetsp:Transcript_11711/g.21282  ORF Transcript_11711/g.21282 Transcript_11711/m.21282 type:complete len:323 (-) Transcript_11711:71-1039(-)
MLPVAAAPSASRLCGAVGLGLFWLLLLSQNASGLLLAVTRPEATAAPTAQQQNSTEANVTDSPLTGSEPPLDECYEQTSLGQAVTLSSSGVEAAFRLKSSPAAKRFQTCAVVGSGSSLQGKEFGKCIDAHDAVIRMNAHPTLGFEADVGNKTTFRLLYPESSALLWDPNEAADVYVLVPFKAEDRVWFDCFLASQSPCHCVAARTQQNHLPFWSNKACREATNPYGITAVLSSRERDMEGSCARATGLLKRPSIGFTSVILALSVCDAIDVYGMDSHNRYHAKDSAVVNYSSSRSDHDFQGEHRFYEQMQALGRLRRPDKLP